MSLTTPASHDAQGSTPTAEGLDRGNPADLAALLSRAQAMRLSGMLDSRRPALLCDKHLALLCAGVPGEAVALFTRAASALGARVAVLSADLAAPDPRDDAKVARLLSRLYDAIECQGLPAARVARIGRLAGLPAYCGLAGAGHPTAALVPLLGLPADQARELLVQAALVATLDQA